MIGNCHRCQVTTALLPICKCFSAIRSGWPSARIGIDRQVGQPLAQGVAVDPQQAGRAKLVAAGLRQGVHDQRALEFGQGILVQMPLTDGRDFEPSFQCAREADLGA